MIIDPDPIRLAHPLSASTDEMARVDARILAHYQAYNPWGLSTAIDLAACDPAGIRDAPYIRHFVIALCGLIEMRPFGEPVIVRFGAEERMCGYSLTQLIETSLIAGHFAEESNSAYIDIFSCKAYPPYRAAQFCRQWFGAASGHISVAYRNA